MGDEAGNEDGAMAAAGAQVSCEYRDKVLRYQLAPPLAADASYPITVSFSSSLPAVCAGVSALIDDYFVFSQYVDDSHTLLLRAVDTALTEHVNAPC